MTDDEVAVAVQAADGGRGRVVRRAQRLIHHEACECGHCRCEHAATYAQCVVPGCQCIRYTWPGEDADLPDDHYRSATEEATHEAKRPSAPARHRARGRARPAR